MAKMTMHQELEMLRQEVETLRKQKEAQERKEHEEAIEAQKLQEEEQEEMEEKAEEILTSIQEGKVEAKEVFSDLLQTIKKDYENLSPTSAIILFALGAAFGHALSSK
jgi:uncharacterized membrane-anchored protein YjiN (DUF445 family)